MTTSRHQRSQQRLVQLLFLASASTAAIISIGGTDLTLSNFQLLTQLSIPLGCLLTYNNPIQGCTANDFSSTGTCSASCRRGLLLMQTNIQDVCQSVSVQANTVLGQALAGNLLGLLCSSNQVTTTSAAPTVRPTSTVIVPPPSSTVVAPPPPPATTVPPVIPPPATTSIAAPPPTQPPVIPPPSTAAPPVSSPPPPVVPPPVVPPPPAPTTVVTSTTSNAAAPQSTSAETTKPPVNPLDALLLSNDSDAAFTPSNWGLLFTTFLLIFAAT
ncbi:heterokaryon incompatibility protein [Colletotrichum asianum]|uniref:Heterokaryon incompatibility protein n=1 Tax=Colletotrichum asianum TaxID=702518 RepID=A0A8H3WGM9_9PEZI|nr:heterokaryon incompatibility protein [Colletotrichum asianum]